MPKLPGLVKGLGVTFKTMLKPAVTVQYPHEKEAPAARARGVIALKEENCTVCMLCARELPRLVHLHRGPQDQGAAPARRRQAPHGAAARPLRHRLRALHVLRHLRRGVPVRRPVLEPRVRVLRAPHRRPAPRQGQARRVDGDRARTAPLEAGAEAKVKKVAAPMVAQNIAFGILAAAIGAGRPAGGHHQERRARRPLPRGRAGRRRRASTSCWPPSSWPSCRSSSTSAPSSCCSSSAIMLTRAPHRPGGRPRQRPARRSAAVTALFLARRPRLRARRRLRRRQAPELDGDRAPVTAARGTGRSATPSSPTYLDPLRGRLRAAARRPRRRHRPGPAGLSRRAAQPVPPARRRPVLHRRLRRARPHATACSCSCRSS